MIYLIIGIDQSAKDKKMAEIKSQICPTEDALRFDYDNLYGNKLDAEELKKSLVALPAIGKQRLVVVHQVHKLKAPLQKIILEFAESNVQETVLILESAEMEVSNAFAKKLKKFAEVFSLGSKKSLSPFDMTNAMQRGRRPDAIRLLRELMDSGSHPLQLMGVLVWYWGKARERVSKERFQQGLVALQEADLSIKRSRLRPDYVMEVLVMKLI